MLTRVKHWWRNYQSDRRAFRLIRGLLEITDDWEELPKKTGRKSGRAILHHEWRSHALGVSLKWDKEPFWGTVFRSLHLSTPTGDLEIPDSIETKVLALLNEYKAIRETRVEQMEREKQLHALASWVVDNGRVIQKAELRRDMAPEVLRKPSLPLQPTCFRK